MATCRIVAMLEVEGRPLDQSPIVVTCEAPFVMQFNFVLEDYADWQLPTCTLPSTVTTLIFTTTQDISLRFNNQDVSYTPLEAGGVCVLANVLLDQSPVWKILNLSGQQTRIRGLALGS